MRELTIIILTSPSTKPGIAASLADITPELVRLIRVDRASCAISWETEAA
jgi:hypothetical protein